MDAERLKEFCEFMQKIGEYCGEVRLDSGQARIKRILDFVGSKTTIRECQNELRILRETIEDQISKRQFTFISPEKVAYFENPMLFGDKVKAAFPSAAYDIQEAGTTYAVGLNTACVFHLMRASERGMRTLAWDRRVKFKNKSPLEMQGWEAIIRGVETETVKIVGWSNRRGLAKAQANEFYNSALEEFRAFRDAWRNHVMHSRRNYNSSEAKGIMDHVTRFMKTLATHISESNRTPRVWNKNQIVAKP